MECLHHVLEASRRKLIFIGYIRNCMSTKIPTDVLKTIWVYYNDKNAKLHVQVSRENLLFCEELNGIKFKSLIFEIENIKFKLEIYPIKQYIAFTIYAQSMPPNIDHITLYFCLLCPQTETQYKNTVIIKEKSTAFGWPSDTLPLSQCIHSNSIMFDFYCCIDILQIAHSYHYHYCDVDANVSMKSCYYIDVVVDEEMVEILMYPNNEENSAFFMDDIGDYWSLIFVKHKAANDINHELILKLLTLPPHISSIKVNTIWSSRLLGKKHSELCGEYMFDLHDKNEKVLLTLNGMESHNFSIEIKLMEIFSVSGDIIDAVEWNKYGIENNECSLLLHNNKIYQQYVQRHKVGHCFWKISGIQLGIFLSAPKYELFNKKEIEIGDIDGKQFVFDIYLYPNGSKQLKGNTHKFIQFVIKLKKIAFQFGEMVIFYRLHCIEMNVEFKDILTLISKKQNIINWPVRSLKLSEVCNKNIKSLHFNCSICIIKIANIYAKPLAMNSNIKYKWNVNQKLLNKFMSCRYGQSFHSKTFNNCWSLACFPNGFQKKDVGNLRLSLILLGLPPNIKSIVVHFMLQSNYNQIRFEADFEFSYDENNIINHICDGWNVAVFPTKWLDSNKLLFFIVTIAVLEISPFALKKKKKNKINDEEWINYKIIANNFYDSNGKNNNKNIILHDCVEWNINNQNLHKFYSSPPHTIHSRKEFTLFAMTGIKLCCYLYPNGGKLRSKIGYLQMIIFVAYIPWHIDTIKIKYDMSCLQSLSQYKCVGIIDRERSNNRQFGWKQYNIKLLKLKEKECKCINLKCNIQILEIKYNCFCVSDKILLLNTKNRKNLDYYKNILIHCKNKFEWNIGGKLLAKFRNNNSSFYNSKNIDNHWILTLFANGTNLLLHLQLLKLPKYCGAIKAYIILHSNYGDITKKFTISVSYEKNKIIQVMDFPISWLYKNEMDICFTLWIEIKQIYDISGKLVDRTHWNKLSIIDNDYDNVDIYDTTL